MNYLPETVAEFFRAANDAEYEDFIKVFTKDVYVFDEGQEMKGIEAIKKWSKDVIFDPNVKFKIVNFKEQDSRVTVTVEVDGDFDKTGLPVPLVLDHHFKLKFGKVRELICSATK